MWWEVNAYLIFVFNFLVFFTKIRKIQFWHRHESHLDRCNVSPLRGEKPKNRPVSKNNTDRAALRADPAGKQSRNSDQQCLKLARAVATKVVLYCMYMLR